MNEVLIRKAEEKDCQQILSLIRELAIYEKASNEVVVNSEHFTESGFGKKPVWWAFVAEIDQKIIGFTLYYIRYSTWKGQQMYLEDFVVTHALRGKGIGNMLFKSLLEESKRKKLNGIVWQVLDWNEPAINFYRKHNATFDTNWINCSKEVE